MGLLRRLFGKGETTPHAATSADDPGDAPVRPQADWSLEAHPEMDRDTITAREEVELAARDAPGFAPSPEPAPEYIPEAGLPTQQHWTEEEQRYQERAKRPPGT